MESFVLLEHLEYLIYNLKPSYILIIITFIVGLFRFSRLSNTERLIFYVVLVNALVDTFANKVWFFQTNNSWMYNISIVFELGPSFWVYITIATSSKEKKIMIAIFTLLCVLSILNMVFFQKMDVVNTYTYIPFGLILGIISYRYFRKQMGSISTENEGEAIKNLSLINLFSLANFIYFAISLPLVSTLRFFIVNQLDIAKNMKMGVNIVYCIWSLIIMIGFYAKRK